MIDRSGPCWSRTEPGSPAATSRERYSIAARPVLDRERPRAWLGTPAPRPPRRHHGLHRTLPRVRGRRRDPDPAAARTPQAPRVVSMHRQGILYPGVARVAGLLRRQPLGRTGFEIGVIGFGAWQIGGAVGRLGWKSQDDAISIAAIHVAVEAGVDWIDTAPGYGLGHSEEVVGRALRGMAERPLVFTKCGIVWDDAGNQGLDLSPSSIRREAQDSLRRLGVDMIDLYQIHWPIPDRDVEAAWETLAELKRAGLVRAIGVSNFTVEQMTRAQAIAPIESHQPTYSLIDRRVEDEILPYCAEHDIGVLIYSPLASGLLSGSVTRERLEADPTDWRHQDPLFQEPHLSEHLALVGVLREISAATGATVADIALAWTLRNPAVTAAIVGFSRPDQITGVLGGAALELNAAELDVIERAVGELLVSPPPEPRLVPPSPEGVG